MVDANELECRRLQIQAELDAGRTRADRNKLGQFATPPALALDILQQAHRLLPSESAVRFLDPAFGTGSFYSALLQVFSTERIASATGFEIDPYYGDKARDLWRNTPLDLRIEDFTRAIPPTGPDEASNLLICNPPYVRHHHLASEEKTRLQELVQQVAGIRLSGLAGLYCYYLCIAHAWMAKDGIAGWLIPSEFMDVNYGQALKKYLLNRVTLLRIHRFDPGEVQFDDALVSSAVVWFRMAPPPANHTVHITYGGSLAAPTESRVISAEALQRAPKWTNWPPALHHTNDDRRAQTRLSDLFTIRRGLVTGSNGFFMLTPETITRYQIPERFLKPILPSARYLTTDEIAADESGNPLLEPRLFLLTCDAPEAEIQARYPLLWQYLQTGVEAGVNKGYLCRHRTPWYRQEERPPAPFLCTYMGRDTQRDKPFRFILNHSRATAANTYLLLYPKPRLAAYLREHPQRLRQVWQRLGQITPAVLKGNGRVYGGGLHKIEPSELGNARIDAIAEALTEPQAEQMTLF
jgi:adenine-specific DNA-methyltransferase